MFLLVGIIDVGQCNRPGFFLRPLENLWTNIAKYVLNNTYQYIGLGHVQSHHEPATRHRKGSGDTSPLLHRVEWCEVQVGVAGGRRHVSPNAA
jgi:hypothetical protein